MLTARITDARGELVGALMVHPDDEVFAITSSGGVIRTSAAEVKLSGRQTMGVRLMNLAAGDSVVAIARNAETLADSVDEDEEEAGTGPAADASTGLGDPDGTDVPDGAEPETGPGNDGPGGPADDSGVSG